MLKSILFEEKVLNIDIHPIKRHKIDLKSFSKNDIAVIPYEDNSRFLVCSQCKSYILTYFFVCQMCGAPQNGRPALYCPSCVCESFHCGHTESFILCKTICTTEYLENILIKTKDNLPDIYSSVESPDDSTLSYMTIAYTMLCGAKSDVHATCHQCKLSKTLDKLAFCTSLHQDTRKKKNIINNLSDTLIAETGLVMKSCTKKYCSSCLWNRYMIRISDCLRYKSWKCPFCKGECNCSACLKKKGVDPSNLEIPFASRHSVAQSHKPPRPRIRRKTKGVSEEEMANNEKDDGNDLNSLMFRSVETIAKPTLLNENTEKQEGNFCVTVGNLSSVPARVKF